MAATNTIYYVDGTNGNDKNPGTELVTAFKTIQQAADIMQPGDTVFIRGGVYRESIRPPRGGDSETQRITYQAYPGETPIIKGSVQITSWKKLEGNVWKVELPDAFFGAYNPFATNISGAWLFQGKENHLGEVYLNHEIYHEYFTLDKVKETAKSWYTTHEAGITTIYANYADANPNLQLAEIAVKECLFTAAPAGAKYITIDGLIFMQSATNWAPNNNAQKGMITVNGGYGWNIQNCHLEYAKCVGIACQPNAAMLNDIATYGHHIIRNNLIEKCGQSGISGCNGLVVSLIEGNLIQEINYLHEFGGAESAGIKLHYAIDVVIKNNIIRRLYDDVPEGDTSIYGIWIDWAGQGTRITGNVVYDAYFSAAWNKTIYLEFCHGPVLCDNNIMLDIPLGNYSERTILAHNLFVNAGISYHDIYSDHRRTQYWQPHTHTSAGSDGCQFIGDRYYNNVFIGQAYKFDGKNTATTDYKAGSNLYYQGITKLPADQDGVLENNFNPHFTHTDLPNGVQIRFDVSPAALNLQCPLINYAFIGKYSVVNQGIEQHDGTGITIDIDCLGNQRNATKPTVGPLENIKEGSNTFTFLAGPDVKKGDNREDK